MIETSTTSSSSPPSKRKSKLKSLLVVSSMLCSAFFMMKYQSFASTSETKISSKSNTSSIEEALIISRTLQGKPTDPSGGNQPLDKLLAKVVAVKSDTESIIDIALQTDQNIADIDAHVDLVKTDTESIINNAIQTDQNIADIDAHVALVKTDTESIIDSVKDVDKFVSDLHNIIKFPPRLQLSLSITHVCAVLLGSVQCVGLNNFGQLGVDTSIMPRTSIPVTLTLPFSLSPVKVVTGDWFTCILTNIKTVFCVGTNNYHQLGHGENSKPSSYQFVQVVKTDGSPLTNVIDIEAGPLHTCAIYSTGSIYCWGRNDANELGWNDEEVEVKMMAIAAFGTCIVKSDFPSHVYCKGARYKQMYDMGEEVLKITASESHFCVLLANHRAKCAGWNDSGQLGNGERCNDYCGNDAIDVLTSSTDSSPLSGITDIFAGGLSTCVLVNGQPMCFGWNRYFQLGNAFDEEDDGEGDDILFPTPLQMTLPSDKEAVSVHVGTHTGHIVFSDNSIYAWGKNSWGTLGDKSEDFSKTIGALFDDQAVAMQFDLPIATESILDKIDHTHGAYEDIKMNVATLNEKVDQCSKQYEDIQKSLSNIIEQLNKASDERKDEHKYLKNSVSYLTRKAVGRRLQLSLTDSHVCAFYDSTVKCVGWSNYGQLQSQLATFINEPVTLTFAASLTPTKVVTGKRHTCTLLCNSVYCNGNNNLGQLGEDMTGATSNDPVQVKKNGSYLEDIVDIKAGPDHTCAIDKSSTISCWGKDYNNMLGFYGQENVALMALSDGATCVVLKSDVNTVKCKGSLTDNGDFYEKDYSMNQDIVKIAGGSSHFCALLKDTTAKCFGLNGNGQLGNGSTMKSVDEQVHVLVSKEKKEPLSGITDINPGYLSTCLVANGDPMCFGSNSSYQLGIANNGANVLYPTALDVSLPSRKSVASVHVGYATGHVVYTDNSVYAFGTNRFGALGDGSDKNNQIGNTGNEAVVEMLFNFESCE